jgi:hypothetical protein
MTGQYGTRGDSWQRPIQNAIQAVERMLAECDIGQKRRPEMAEEIEGLRKDLLSVLERLRRMEKS